MRRLGEYPKNIPFSWISVTEKRRENPEITIEKIPSWRFLAIKIFCINKIQIACLITHVYLTTTDCCELSFKSFSKNTPEKPDMRQALKTAARPLTSSRLSAVTICSSRSCCPWLMLTLEGVMCIRATPAIRTNSENHWWRTESVKWLSFYLPLLFNLT